MISTRQAMKPSVRKMWNSSRFVIFFFFFLFECLPSFDARPHTLSSCSNTQREEKLFLSLEQSKEREMELESELESTKSAVAELEVHPTPFFGWFFALAHPPLLSFSCHREPLRALEPQRILRSRTSRPMLRVSRKAKVARPTPLRLPSSASTLAGWSRRSRPARRKLSSTSRKLRSWSRRLGE